MQSSGSSFRRSRAHHDVDGARVQLRLVAAKTVQDVVATPDLAGLVREQGQQLELGAGQVDALAVAQHLALVEVDRQSFEHAALRRRGCRHGALAPQDGLHARDQLARLEGLGQVVVGTEFESDHAVHHVAAGGQHDDRDVAFLADLAAQRKAVHLGEHHVEDGGVVAFGAELGEAVARAGGAVEHAIEAREVACERRTEMLVIVDQQDSRHGVFSLAPRLAHFVWPPSPCRGRRQRAGEAGPAAVPDKYARSGLAVTMDRPGRCGRDACRQSPSRT